MKNLSPDEGGGNPYGSPYADGYHGYQPSTGYTPPPPTAHYGDPLPVVYGRARVRGQLVFFQNRTAADIYYRDGSGIFQVLRGVAGGEAAAVAYAICEAPVSGVLTIWKDLQDQYDQANLGYLGAVGTAIEFVTGSTAPAWSFWNSSTGTVAPLSGAAMNWTAYMRCAALSLNEGKVPKLEFLVHGRCCQPYEVPYWGDAHPADVIVDLMSDPRIGLGLSASMVDVDSAGYRAWCTAMGFFVSRAISSQENISDLLESLMEETHATAVWSGGRLRVVPKGAFATGSYAPPMASVLIDENELIFKDGEDPITVSRTPLADVYNCFPVTMPDAANGYESSTYELVDQGHASKYGLRRADAKSLTWITSARSALKLSSLWAQESIYIRNKYTFTVGPRWAALEPTDLVSLSEAKFGLSQVLVRIASIEDQEDGARKIEAIEWPIGKATALDLTPQAPDGYASTPIWNNPVSDAWLIQSGTLGTVSGSVVVLSGTLVNVSGTAASASASAGLALSSASMAQSRADAAFSSATLAFSHADDAFASASAAFSASQGKANVDLGNIAPGTITGIMVGSGTLSGSNLKAGTIEGQHISGSTIQGTHIKGQTIQGQHISGSTIEGQHIKTNTLTAANINTNEFKVNYAEDGSGNPTQGVKIFDATVPLKIGPGGAKVGRYELSEPVVRSLSALAQSSDGNRVWYRGSQSTVQAGNPVLMDATFALTTSVAVGDRRLNQARTAVYVCTQAGTTGSTDLSGTGTGIVSGTSRWNYVGTMASQERIRIYWMGYTGAQLGTTGMYRYEVVVNLQPRTANDNLDAIRSIELDFYDNSGTSGAAALMEWVVLPMGERRYVYSLEDGNVNNACQQTVKIMAPRNPAIGNVWVDFRLATAGGYSQRFFRGDASQFWVDFASVTNLPGGTVPPPPPPDGDTGGGTCPAPEMLILMADGSHKRADDIRDGDVVRTKHETTGVWGDYPVIYAAHFYSERISVRFAGGNAIACSPGHRLLLTDGTWMDASALQPGMMVDGPEPMTVDSLAVIPSGPVVKLTVDDAHTYVCQGMVSHNVKRL